MDVELRHLRAFLAVAEELNFTRAAARVRIDQAALSRQIRALEGALGTPLFLRTTRSVNLTEAGELLRTRVEEIVRDVDNALALVKASTTERRSHIRLGWLVPFREQLMARIVREFERSTSATVLLQRFTFADPSAGLAAGLVDAAIVNPPISASGLRYIPLLVEPRVVLVADSHALARASSATLADLDALDATWALPPTDDQVWQAFWGCADLPGRTLPARRVEFAENQDYLQAVAAGHVIGLSLAAAVGDELAEYGIAAVHVTDIPPATISMAFPQRDPHPLAPALAAAAHVVASSLGSAGQTSD